MCISPSHNIGQHSAPRGDEHDHALDGVVITDEALYRQVNQHSCYQPYGEDGQQRTQDLCMGEEMSTVTRFMKLQQNYTQLSDCNNLGGCQGGSVTLVWMTHKLYVLLKYQLTYTMGSM